MNLSDSITARFSQLHPRKIDLSLDRIARLLKDLGDPQLRAPPTIHVAGTNGKGSTVAFLRAALEAAGKRVHVYTSPHLVRFNERFRLAGQIVDDERLQSALDRCEAVNDGQPISIFEITTAAAFLMFAETPADWLLLEVGLGGRFDATNVIGAPKAAVITPISMDHPEFLGASIAAIAREKAGILKRGTPGVIAEQTNEASREIERAAIKVGAPLTVAGLDFHVRSERDRLVFEDRHGLLDLPAPRLAGRHQFGNAALAIATLRTIAPEIDAAPIETGLVTAEWPARLQRLRSGTIVAMGPPQAEVWLDGAHNDAGGRVLAEAMADFEDRAQRPLALICGTLASKDTAAFLSHFKGLVQEMIAVPLPADHSGRSAEDVAALAREAGLRAASCDGLGSAMRYLAARKWSVPPRILIAGSLYLAGEMLRANGTEIR